MLLIFDIRIVTIFAGSRRKNQQLKFINGIVQRENKKENLYEFCGGGNSWIFCLLAQIKTPTCCIWHINWSEIEVKYIRKQYNSLKFIQHFCVWMASKASSSANFIWIWMVVWYFGFHCMSSEPHAVYNNWIKMVRRAFGWYTHTFLLLWHN